jgi:hypothetical protein
MWAKLRKKPDQMERMFGKPTFTDNITPSGAPCPCVKKIYLNRDIEIVFINNLSSINKTAWTVVVWIFYLKTS